MNTQTGRPNNPIFNSPNKLKLGVFCTNTLQGFTTVPELLKPTWENCLEVARRADAAGLEAIVPIARWKGYLDGQFNHPSNEILDTFTYAAAIAQATRYSAVFATTHAPTIHPLVVAKQTSTIDAISNGRFVMNVVGGWNRREFSMFGIDLLEHEDRYTYLAQWLGIIRRLWTETEEFDLDSKYFKMRGAVSRPQPVQKPAIPIMNAGHSSSGMHFAAEHADIGLVTLFGDNPEQWAKQITDYKSLAKDTFGREIQVWTNASITIRDTREQAQDYLQHYAEDHLDREAYESFIDTLSRENNMLPGSPAYEFLKKHNKYGPGVLIAGTPEDIAGRLELLSTAGLDGLIITFIDFLDGIDRLRRDVLPLLEASGLRQPFKADY